MTVTMGRRIHSARLKFVCRFGFPFLLIRSATQANVLRVDVTGIRNDHGAIYCQLFADAKGFPRKVSKTTAVVRAQIQDGSATCAFANVSPGSYAVAVYHDENGNGRLDRGILGIPKEGLEFLTMPSVRGASQASIRRNLLSRPRRNGSSSASST